MITLPLRVFGLGENLADEFGFGGIVGIFHHGWTDGGVEAFFYGQSIVVPKECEGLVGA